MSKETTEYWEATLPPNTNKETDSHPDRSSSIRRKIGDNLDVTRRKWAEEQASGVWEAAAQRQAERERREKKVEKPVHNETKK
jgi:hypothetical protein